MPGFRRRTIWHQREDLRPLLEKTVRLFPTILAHVKPDKIFLCSFMKPKSKHVARIVPNRHPWCLLHEQYDYSIEFHENVFESMKKSKKVYVMLHELLHIPDGGCKKGVRNHRRTVHHDLQDFDMLRKVYGLRLERVKDVLQGEKGLLHLKGEVRRFPRLMSLG